MRTDGKRNDKIHVPYASRFEIALCATLGCVSIVVFALLYAYLKLEGILSAVISVVFYICAIIIIAQRRRERLIAYNNKNIYALLSENGSVFIKENKNPVITFDDHGKVLWYNDAFRFSLGLYENHIGKDLKSLIGSDFVPEHLTGEKTLSIGDTVFSVQGFVISEDNGGLYALSLCDITKLSAIEKRYNDERTVVAYIAIDNVEDVLQYVHEKFIDAVAQIDDKLKKWAANMNGVIKSYDTDKYIMMFDHEHLEQCIKDRFSILDDIRDTRVGDGISITVSIGVSEVGNSVADRERSAREAIDLALQRGGDQVVYKTESSVEYYGGRTKSVYKKSNVRSRTFAAQMTSLMSRSDNVIVMGHKFGDFDSFGASVGVARLAMLCSVKVNIAIDMRDKNLLPCIEVMQELPEYSNIFVDYSEGIDLISGDTLVVLVDHSGPSRAQFPNIADKASAIVVVDHHRKNDTLHPSVKENYIEPSASSCCELVTEMLESSSVSNNITKEEADMLLAGILLDTKQFTRNTGTRTFSAAQFLRDAGADPTDVYALFKTSPEELSKEARFHTAITIYNENIAISSCDGDTDESYRIIASKAADKMLTLKGIDAAFTIVRIGETVHISGRSSGKINVQLILEKLNGGGHFDVAGAQVVSSSVLSVLETLKSSIDDYLEI